MLSKISFSALLCIIAAYQTQIVSMAPQDEQRALELMLNDEYDMLGFCLNQFKSLKLYKYPQYEGKTLLHKAVDSKKVKMVNFLLRQGFDVNAQDNEGTTPLHIAAFNDSPTLIKLLLDAGADSLLQDNQKLTAYQHAATRCEAATAELIKAHQETAQQKQAAQKALEQLFLRAIVQKDIKTVMRLLKQNSLLTSLKYGEDQNTALHYATVAKHTSIIALLLHHGAPVNAPNGHNATPLMLAVEKDTIDAIALLIDYGADVNSNPAKLSLIEQAVLNNSLDSLQLLLDHGACITPTALLTSALYVPLNQEQQETSKQIIRVLADNLQQQAPLCAILDALLNKQTVEQLGEEKALQASIRLKEVLTAVYTSEIINAKLAQLERTIKNALLEKECPICFEIMQNESAATLPCNHRVCSECKKDIHQCPLCRQHC